MVELALVAPWLLLLFPAIFDFGVFSNSLISIENAARAAALQTSIGTDSAADSSLACAVVLDQLKKMPHLKDLQSCDRLPLVVNAIAGVDAEGFATSRVLVTYQTERVFALPFLPSQLTLNRAAEMRVKP